MMHFSVDGHLVCSFSLAIMNNVAKNTCVQVFCGYRFSFLLDIYPGVEMLSPVITLYLTLLRNGWAVFHNSCTIVHSC